VVPEDYTQACGKLQGASPERWPIAVQSSRIEMEFLFRSETTRGIGAQRTYHCLCDFRCLAFVHRRQSPILCDGAHGTEENAPSVSKMFGYCGPARIEEGGHAGSRAA